MSEEVSIFRRGTSSTLSLTLQNLEIQPEEVEIAERFYVHLTLSLEAPITSEKFLDLIRKKKIKLQLESVKINENDKNEYDREGTRFILWYPELAEGNIQRRK